MLVVDDLEVRHLVAFDAVAKRLEAQKLGNNNA